MALFKRNKKESVMPEEVQNFYAAERRQRKGATWLLAFVTLVITFLIASALFFGGRWAYRAIFDKNDTSPTSQEQAAEEQKSEENTESTSPSSTGANDSAGNSNSSSTPQANSGSGSSATTPSPQSVPATGSNQLVNTGPGDE